MTNKKNYINKQIVEFILYKYNNGLPITRKDQIFHQNIIGTLKSGYKYVRNIQEDEEYFKCKSSIIYFIETYCKLQTPVLKLIKLRQYQIECINEYTNNRFLNYLTSRQTGNSQILACIYLWEMLFNRKSIYHMSIKSNTGKDFLNKIKNMYLHLPYFLKSNIEIFNSKNLKFSNGAQIKISSKFSSLLNFDIYSIQEYSIFKSDTLNVIYPIVLASKDSKIVISSQPNGFNHYYTLTTNSERKLGDPKKNVFKTVRTYWWEVSGRNQEWKKEMIKQLESEEKFDQEYDLQFIQMNKK